MEVKGVYTAMITPFTQDGAVDYEGFRKNVQFQIQGGVSGILPLGTTGETPTLSREEQDKIIQIAVEEAKGKVVVMIGTGSNSTEHTIENTQRAKELGADIALVVTPYYNKPSQEGIVKHFEAVHNAVDIPIMVYNIQGRTGVNIATPTLKRIAALPNIVGVKEASGNIDQMGEVVTTIADGHPHFSVMSGDDSMTLPLLSLGGSGVISVVSNLVPKKLSEMVSAGLSGDFETARKLHYALLPLFKGAFIETNPVPMKEAMNLTGLAAGPVRLPLCQMQPQNKEKVSKLLKEMGLLS